MAEVTQQQNCNPNWVLTKDGINIRCTQLTMPAKID